MSPSWALLGITLALLGVLAAITWRTYRRGRKGEMEKPKYRMLEDD